MADDQKSEFTVDLDRIEEGIAVILVPGGFDWHLPQEYLPQGVTEGMTMRVTLRRDTEATSARIDRIRDLRSRLENR
jgi:hypothetical protein